MVEKQFFSKEEVVVEILDDAFADNRYVFSDGRLDASSVFNAAANTRSGVFIKGKSSTDRQDGDEVMINASRVNRYKKTRVKAPERIVSLIEELEGLDAHDEENEEKIMEIQETLRFYFQS